MIASAHANQHGAHVESGSYELIEKASAARIRSYSDACGDSSGGRVVDLP